MFEMLSLDKNAGPQSWPPLFDGLINDALLQQSPDTGEALLQVVDVPYRCLVDAFLYQPPDPIVASRESISNICLIKMLLFFVNKAYKSY